MTISGIVLSLFATGKAQARPPDISVHVRTSEELGAVISAGVHPARLTVHADGVLTNELVFCAANLTVGHIVVNSVEHIEIHTRAIGRQRRQAVLVRIVDTGTNGESAAVMRAILASARLSLTGLHADIGTAAADFVSYPAAVGDLICTMDRIRQSHGRVLTRLSLGGVPTVTESAFAVASGKRAA